MSSKELELALMNIILVMGAILILLFIFRVIKVLTSKKIESKDDVGVILFLLGFICLIGYCVYKIKTSFKKEDKHPVV